MGHKFATVPINDLYLDPENPRLPAYVERDQDSMFSYLAQNSSIEELMTAISENDFFQAEALIAVPVGKELIVVEGNRRLTALKLLSGQTFDQISTRISELQASAKHRPSSVPVAIYDSREEVLNYLGNRHIAGVKPWGALAKARYIKQLFDHTSSQEDFPERCRTVAKIIGSRRDFISKSMKAYQVYEVAEKNDFFSLEGVDEEAVKFSLISTSVDYSGIQKFIFGASEEETGESINERDPIIDNVREFFSWLFVREEGEKPRIGESRNLNKLSKVLLNDDALAAFRKGASLDQAYLYTTGVGDDFDAICTRIQRELREANSIAAEVERTEVREQLTNSIYRQARALESAFRD
ncbi:hypothetical protein LB515_27900 [Mesorhizobium sp. CA15]|uniref:hypothetical protein n=1 Tax=Mesorhizobium sp. CA15 TaxID=2876641 RepID=UPI001CD14134|nr:hypothetical protein [Mesorhizobium sp. CA15]MBZ9869217.1 hypothetical protein [Mesorhizobium sp. CA15]